MVLALYIASLLALAGVSLGDAVNDLEAEGRIALDAQMAKSTTCSQENLMVRREWGDLSKDERREYIAAAQCMIDSPSKFEAGRYPGVVTRYEDFVAVHVNQTGTIHGTGNFLSWHRYFVWAYERALRDECGYTGAQPYWDYGRTADDPENSPMFDGSDTSMSGNGAKAESSGIGFSNGNGGGCVTSGPFANMTVRLGPVIPISGSERNPQADGFGDNTRCLKRDIGPELTSNYGQTQNIVDLLTIPDTFSDFQAFLEGGSTRGFGGPAGGFGGGFGGGGGGGRAPGTLGTKIGDMFGDAFGGVFSSSKTRKDRKMMAKRQRVMGLHGVGHFTIAGDPGSDPFISPNDPAFWMHHAMVDRMWTIWQTLDMEKRLQVVEGRTNIRESPQATLDDIVNMDILAPEYTIRELNSIVEGPFCYVYE